MKWLFILIFVSLIVPTAAFACGGCRMAQAQVNENVSFYQVPLVCEAAPKIGCGSKAKPVLLWFEKRNNIVSEAWLNRAGTIIAIVWNNNTSYELRTTTADSIFKENKMDVKLLSGKEHKKLLKEFQEKKIWYRGEEVNKLSLEEADIIAERFVNRINAKTPLSQEKMQSLKTEFANVFKIRFTQNYSSEINSNESKEVKSLMEKVENELLKVGKKYLNEKEMAALKDAMAMGYRPLPDKQNYD